MFVTIDLKSMNQPIVKSIKWSAPYSTALIWHISKLHKISTFLLLFCLYSLRHNSPGVELITFLLNGNLNFIFYFVHISISIRLITIVNFRRVNWEENISKVNSTKNPDNKPATNESSVDHDRQTFSIIYMCIVLVGIALTVSQSFSFYRMCLRISVNLHDMIFNCVTRAKMIFFHNNSSGRILNRFTKDINCVDTSLPTILIDVFGVSFIHII